MENGKVAIKEYLPSKKGNKSELVMVHGKRQDGSHFQIECIPRDMSQHVLESVKGFISNN